MNYTFYAHRLYNNTKAEEAITRLKFAQITNRFHDVFACEQHVHIMRRFPVNETAPRMSHVTITRRIFRKPNCPSALLLLYIQFFWETYFA